MPAIQITRHCRHEHCLPDLDVETKEEAISEIIGTFVASGALDEDGAAQLFGEILAREERASTGIGRGIALPHPDDGASDVIEDTLIGVGLHREGLDWHATDDAPVHVVFVIASDDPQTYLKVASRVVAVARDDVEMKALLRQTTAKDMHAFLEGSWGVADG